MQSEPLKRDTPHLVWGVTSRKKEIGNENLDQGSGQKTATIKRKRSSGERFAEGISSSGES